MSNRTFTAANSDHTCLDLKGDPEAHEQATATSLSNSETEFKGYVYLSDDDEDDNISSFSQMQMPSIPRKETNNYNTPSSILTPSLFPNVPPTISFSSHIEKGPAIPNDLRPILKWRMTAATQNIVQIIVTNTGFQLVNGIDNWIGSYGCIHPKKMQEYQKFNRIPGTDSLSDKGFIWRNIQRKIQQFGKKNFGIMPESYILPGDLTTLRESWETFAKHETKWIVKPPDGSYAQGVYLISKWSEVPHWKKIIVQKYIERPLPIKELKFDLRIYVLVTSMNPMRIFIHTEGLARFATVKYSNKIDTIRSRMMHITNYSVNKYSKNYRKNQGVDSNDSHKWCLTSLWSYLRGQNINTERIWGTIRDLVIRTVISCENIINQNMLNKSQCNYYSLLGFDVLLDENLTPWLCEVNRNPLLNTATPADRHANGPFIQAVFNTVGFQVPPVLTNQQENKILSQLNLSGPLCFDRRIYFTNLSPAELKKHNRFTSDAIKSRNDYLDAILENLTPSDIRYLVVAEDELARCSPLERLFPGPSCHKYLEFIEKPRYYNRLLDAWEARYASNRQEGIRILQNFCLRRRHLAEIRRVQFLLFTYEVRKIIPKYRHLNIKDT